jgi:hypothetical protein
LGLEQLGDRIVPTSVTWNGAWDGFTWSDGRNWVGGSVPTSVQTAVFNNINAGPLVTVDFDSLASAPLNVEISSTCPDLLLNLQQNMHVYGHFYMYSGELDSDIGTSYTLTVEGTATNQSIFEGDDIGGNGQKGSLVINGDAAMGKNLSSAVGTFRWETARTLER